MYSILRLSPIWLFVSLSACGGTLAVVADGAADSAADAAPNDAGPDAPIATPSWKLCQQTSECIVTSATCCGVCGMPNISQVTSINGAMESAYRKANCTPEPPCPGCASMPNANLLAECRSQVCEAFDVSTSPYAACKTDGDCSVQHTTCCGCSNVDLVAANKTLSAYVNAADPSCAAKDCVACKPPKDYWAHCGSNGFCVLSILE